MPESDNFISDQELHRLIIMKIWDEIAPEIYQAYLEQGRGVVAMFMLDTLPGFIKDRIPEGEGVISGSVMSAYIPLDRLHTLEDLVGLEGALKIDEQVHRYDPAASIVFAFFDRKSSRDGTRGVSCWGYEITPPPRHSPAAMYKKNNPGSGCRNDPTHGGDHPLINRN